MDFHLAVEGFVEQVVLERLCADAGHGTREVYGLRGRDFVEENIRGWHAGSGFDQAEAWLVQVDLETDACPGALIDSWLNTHPPDHFVCSVAIRQVEAWLMADIRNCAKTFRVQRQHWPASPEMLPHAKRALLDLLHAHAPARIRTEMVPRSRLGTRTGPLYIERITEFIRNSWDPQAAAANAPSLARLLHKLDAF